MITFSGQAKYMRGVSRDIAEQVREKAGNGVELRFVESDFTPGADAVFFTKTDETTQAIDQAVQELGHELFMTTDDKILSIGGINSIYEAVRKYPLAVTVMDWMRRGVDLPDVRRMLEPLNLWF